MKKAGPVLAYVLLGMSLHAAAQAAYPERPIRLVVPSAAGGSPDTILRIIGNQITKQTGQQVVLDNRPGGSYTIGTTLVASAPPDGYTIGYANLTSLTVNRYYLERPPSYDIDRDLALVIQTHHQPNMLVVTPALPVQSVGSLIEYARSHPGKLLYGSGGNGTSSHIAAELFKHMTGTEIGHVPYKGSPQAITDMIAGQIQLTFNNLVTLAPYVRADKVRGLAVTSEKRSPMFPNLPTVAEGGVPGYQFSVWGGIIAPAKTPKAIIGRLNAEINAAFGLPSVKKQFDELGNTLVGGTPEQFAAFVKSENAKWAPVIKRIRLNAD